MIKCKNIVPENCSFTCHLNEGPIDSSSANSSNSTSKLPQTIQFVGGRAECDKNQNADGKEDVARDQECMELQDALLDQTGPDQMDSSQPGRIVHENQLPEQHDNQFAAYDGDYLITQESSSDMLRLAPPFAAETQSANVTLNADNVFSGKSLSTDGSSVSYINNASHDPHLYWDGAVEGSTTDYIPQLLPGACQNQLASNDQLCNALEEPSEYLPMDQSVCVPRRTSCCYAKINLHILPTVGCFLLPITNLTELSIFLSQQMNFFSCSRRPCHSICL
jgi:hypothetical protein